LKSPRRLFDFFFPLEAPPELTVDSLSDEESALLGLPTTPTGSGTAKIKKIDSMSFPSSVNNVHHSQHDLPLSFFVDAEDMAESERGGTGGFCSPCGCDGGGSTIFPSTEEGIWIGSLDLGRLSECW